MRPTKGKPMLYLMLFSMLMLAGLAVAAQPQTPKLPHLRDRWAQITYQLPKAQREQALEALADEAAEARKAAPRQADVLIWEGIILSSLAGEKGGVGALSLVKRARADFEDAIRIEPRAASGAAYTSLGALYYQVPGWPLGFGDDDKARELLKQGLAVDPTDIDANYFYADFLRDQKDWAGARAAFEKALAAPARQGREVADRGRREEAQGRLRELDARLAH